MTRSRSYSLPTPPQPRTPRRFSASSLILGGEKRFIASDHTVEQLLLLCDDEGHITIDTTTTSSDNFLQVETDAGWCYQVIGAYQLATVLNYLLLKRGGPETGLKRLKQNQKTIAPSSCVTHISSDKILEPPHQRLKNLVDNQFWHQLTRSMDTKTIYSLLGDSKVQGEGVLYLPHASEQRQYYASLDVNLQDLPKRISPEYVLSINSSPGVLALAMDKSHNPLPYIVPGGRFNEMYGWDSYFELLGLLESGGPGYIHIAESMCLHFCYQIKNYGKILNANRSYYLSRSQPPFLTDMGLRVYCRTRNKEFLKEIYNSAVTEYNTVWMGNPRLDRRTGLSKYCPTGLGIPPEVETGHFDGVLGPYAQKYGLTLDEFVQAYNSGNIVQPELDEYFLHDRAIRESGHDTSYRLEGVCADLATVDLNSLLYKYEVDLEYIERELNLSPCGFYEAAERRKEAFTQFLWNSEDSCFYDYNCKTNAQRKYTSSTGLWPLWSGIATREQARGIVSTIASLEEYGGLASGSKASLDEFSGGSGVPRQWDYPNGWAPHQVLAWQGLQNYGYDNVATRLAFKWCAMMVHSFRDYSGLVVEKYNVTDPTKPHVVTAEYGNQGSVASGFGWVNASYVVGLGYLSNQQRQRLEWGVWKRHEKL